MNTDSSNMNVYALWSSFAQNQHPPTLLVKLAEKTDGLVSSMEEARPEIISNIAEKILESLSSENVDKIAYNLAASLTTNAQDCQKLLNSFHCLEMSLLQFHDGKVQTAAYQIHNLLDRIPILANESKKLKNKLLPEPPLQELANAVQVFYEMIVDQKEDLQPCSVQEAEMKLVDAMKQARSLLNEEIQGNVNFFGPKHANLERNYGLIQLLKIPGVKGLKPYALSNPLVEKILEYLAPNLNSLWKELAFDFKADSPILEKIQKEIDSAFAKLKTSKELQARFGLADGEICEWLDLMRSEGKKIIVRSTGAEDSAPGNIKFESQITASTESKDPALMGTEAEDNVTGPNAGGNISIPYVDPNLEEYLEAAGKVVASYYSYISLQNRINSGENPFETKMCCAVTAMEMAGEKIDGAVNPQQIPRSIVIFSNEPLYVGNEKFYVVRGSVALGFGAGVVETHPDVGCDEFLMVISAKNPKKLYIHYENRKKEKRLVPVKEDFSNKISISAVENSPELKNMPALNKRELKRLFHWARVQETYYEGPTDLEIVILGSEIIPVQARPVVRQPIQASYLDFEKISQGVETPILDSLEMQLLVPGNASALILNPADILLCNNLDEANAKFQSQKNKLVIVASQNPPSRSSHAVVNFSSWAIPAFFTPLKKETVQHFFDKTRENQAIVVCSQRGTLHLWDLKKGNPTTAFSKGFITHPARVVSSSHPLEDPLVYLPNPHEIPTKVKRAIVDLEANITSDCALKHFEQLRISINPLLEELEEIQNLNESRALIPYKQAASELMRRINKVFSEMMALLHEQRTLQDPQRLKALFFVRPIATAILEPISSGSISLHSLYNIGSSLKAAKKIASYEEQFGNSPITLPILFAGTQASDPQIQQVWENFLSSVEIALTKGEVLEDYLPGIAALFQFTGLISQPLEVQIVEFISAVQKLSEIDALSVWLMSNFSKLMLQHASPKEIMADLFSLMDEEMLKGQKVLLALVNQVDQLNHNVPCLVSNDHELFQKTWNQWKPLLEAVMDTQQIGPLINSKNWLLRVATANMMYRVTTGLDLAIKDVKMGSYIDEEKFARFKTMVEPDHQLAISWISLIPSASTGMEAKNYCFQANRWLKAINNSRLSPTKLLQASANFSAVAVSAGTPGASEQPPPPRTWEDLFTLAHQNQLIAISSLLCNSYPQINLPPLLQEAITNFPLQCAPEFRVNLVRIRQESNRFFYSWNCPLGSHAAQFELGYDYTQNAIIYRSLFLGMPGAAGGRIIAAEAILHLIQMLQLLQPSGEDTRISMSETSFSFRLHNAEEIQIAITIQKGMLLMMSGAATPSAYSFIDLFKNLKLSSDKHWIAVGALFDSVDLPKLNAFIPFVEKCLKDFPNSFPSNANSKMKQSALDCMLLCNYHGIRDLFAKHFFESINLNEACEEIFINLPTEKSEQFSLYFRLLPDDEKTMVFYRFLERVAKLEDNWQIKKNIFMDQPWNKWVKDLEKKPHIQTLIALCADSENSYLKSFLSETDK